MKNRGRNTECWTERNMRKKEAAWGHIRKTALYRSGNGPYPKTTLRSPWSWTSSLWNCKKINFCHLSHMVCGTLLWQPELRPPFLKITDPMLYGTNLAMCEGTNQFFYILTNTCCWLSWLSWNHSESITSLSLLQREKNDGQCQVAVLTKRYQEPASFSGERTSPPPHGFQYTTQRNFPGNEHRNDPLRHNIGL